MKRRPLSLLPLLCLIACHHENPSTAESPFRSDTTLIADDYPPLDKQTVQIMEQLNLCSDSLSRLPPCRPQLFRRFNYRPEEGQYAGIIIEMVPGLYRSPVHQLVILENRLGSYTIVNQYLGRLIEMRTSPSGRNDLLIGYEDPDIGTVAIKHVWQVNRYQPVDVEEINHHFVRPEMKDSVNALLLPAFNAGH